MSTLVSLDAQVRTRLRSWPQRPPGLLGMGARQGQWMRARPHDGAACLSPFLKMPGSTRMRTMPDGLWLHFGGTAAEPYADIFAIEACGSLANLLDKRSRFAPSTTSLMAVCPLPWLLGSVGRDDPTPRWQRSGVLRQAPAVNLVLPVRDIRVMYALKQNHYRGFATSQVPHAHEYFVPMDALVAERSDQDPAMQALCARASARANFLILP